MPASAQRLLVLPMILSASMLSLAQPTTMPADPVEEIRFEARVHDLLVARQAMAETPLADDVRLKLLPIMDRALADARRLVEVVRKASADYPRCLEELKKLRTASEADVKAALDDTTRDAVLRRSMLLRAELVVMLNAPAYRRLPREIAGHAEWLKSSLDAAKATDPQRERISKIAAEVAARGAEFQTQYDQAKMQRSELRDTATTLALAAREEIRAALSAGQRRAWDEWFASQFKFDNPPQAK